MFYTHGASLTHPQSHTMTVSPSERSTSLPSFNELLTSIPPQHELGPKPGHHPETSALSANSSISGGSSTSSSPSGYYTQPFHARIPHSTPPLGTYHGVRSPSVSGYYQYAPYHLQPQPQPQLQPLGTPGHALGHLSHGSVSHAPIHAMGPSHSHIYAPEMIRTDTPDSPGSPASPGSGTASESGLSSPKEPKRKHMCKVCSRSFTTSGHLARHNRVHTGERKHVCPWPSCDARFARQDNCMQHYKTHTKGKNKKSRLSFKTNNLSSKSFS